MFERLYRIDARDKSFINPSDTEYYQPRIEGQVRDRKLVFLVRETHGYFDHQQKKLVNQTETFHPEDGFADWKEAEARYQEQLRHRAKLGFVHAIAFDPFNPSAIKYRVLSPDDSPVSSTALDTVRSPSQP